MRSIMGNFALQCVCLLAVFTTVCCKAVIDTKPILVEDLNSATVHARTQLAENEKLFPAARATETNTPNFVRLVVMRLIYGIASTMGLEDRLEDVFNGVFVPPNADDDVFGLNGIDDGDEGLSELFDGGF